MGIYRKNFDNRKDSLRRAFADEAELDRAIRQNGVTLFSVCCEYTNPNFDFQLGKSVISMPLREDEPHVKEIIQFNEML